MAFFRSLFSPCGLLFGATPMIVIRSCQGQAELEACVQLQVETWGYDPTDVIPRKAFLVWQKVGGQVIGAATFNDRLHLVYTSYAPVTGLLDQIKAELSGALGNVY